MLTYLKRRLKRRIHWAKVDSAFSELLKIIFSCVEVSVSGPGLFIMYKCDLFTLNKRSVSLAM